MNFTPTHLEITLILTIFLLLAGFLVASSKCRKKIRTADERTKEAKAAAHHIMFTASEAVLKANEICLPELVRVCEKFYEHRFPGDDGDFSAEYEQAKKELAKILNPYRECILESLQRLCQGYGGGMINDSAVRAMMIDILLSILHAQHFDKLEQEASERQFTLESAMKQISVLNLLAIQFDDLNFGERRPDQNIIFKHCWIKDKIREELRSGKPCDRYTPDQED